jgi:transposase InsO family protein
MCVGSAYQNAFAESFNKTLKTQEINVTPYESKLHSFSSILSYIKKYNDYRPHSGLNGMSPNMFEEELKKKEKK